MQAVLCHCWCSIGAGGGTRPPASGAETDAWAHLWKFCLSLYNILLLTKLYYSVLEIKASFFFFHLKPQSAVFFCLWIITPDRNWGTVCTTRDQIQVSHMQGRYPFYCIISLTLEIKYSLKIFMFKIWQGWAWRDSTVVRVLALCILPAQV